MPPPVAVGDPPLAAYDLRERVLETTRTPPDSPGGKWDNLQANMFDFAKRRGHGFFVSSDKIRDGNCVHIFSSFKSAGEFLRCCLEKTAKRHFYELVPSMTHCKAYLDVEYKLYGEEKPTWEETEENMIMAIGLVVQRSFGILNPEIMVLDGTRNITSGPPENKTGRKVSFHFIMPWLVYECNHSGQMKKFAENVQLALVSIGGTGFDGIVDTGVYGNNQKFRMPLCSKITDTTSTVLMMTGSQDMTRASFLQCLLTNTPENPQSIGGGVIWVPLSPGSTTNTPQRSLCSPSAGSANSSSRKVDADLAALLRRHDASTTISSVEDRPDGSKLARCRNNGVRTCIVSAGSHHATNNLYLKIHGQEVYAWCHGHECRGKSLLLGVLGQHEDKGGPPKKRKLFENHDNRDIQRVTRVDLERRIALCEFVPTEEEEGGGIKDANSFTDRDLADRMVAVRPQCPMHTFMHRPKLTLVFCSCRSPLSWRRMP